MTDRKWQTARVFISSTFRDMHAERDWLVKRVFPILRERLERCRIYLDDIDLRWGVTEDQAANHQSLGVCLEQIEDCHPFFVAILGERYGSIANHLTDEVREKFPWIEKYPQRSITELEIRSGVRWKRGTPSHAMFFFRDSSFMSQVPETKKTDVLAENEYAAKRLRKLKKNIQNAALQNKPEIYSCHYQGIRVNWFQARHELSEANQAKLHQVAQGNLIEPHEYDQIEPSLRNFVDRYGQVYVTGLESFGDRVLDRLWEAIKSQFDLPDTPHNDQDLPLDGEVRLSEEADHHDRFIESRLRIYIGRESLQQQLRDFIESPTTRPCVLAGPSGSGKSATLAKFVQTVRQELPDAAIFYHFIGASESSSSVREMLGRLCGEMREHLEMESIRLPDPTAERITLFHSLLSEMPHDVTTILIIDAINQLDDEDHARELHWLPEEVPQNIKFIVSCLEEPHTPSDMMKVLFDRDARQLDIQPLAVTERRQIIREIPKLSAKILDERQVESLLANPATQNPLFLLVALEELRGFSAFDQLSQRILDFPHGDDAITRLFTQVFDRLEIEFDQVLVKRVLILLATSRRGLSERELQDLTSDLSAHVDLFPVLRQLRPYLFKKATLIHFFHQNVALAVRKQYLNSVDAMRNAHGQLGSYFSRQPTSIRKADELPWQWNQSGDLDRLKESLVDLELFSILQEHRPYELLNYWHAIEGRFDMATCYKDACVELEARSEGVDKTWNAVGLFFKTAGLPEAAEQAMRRSLEFRQREKGDDHPDVAQTLNNLGVFAESRGQFVESERLMRRALSIAMNSLGSEHIETGRIQNGLGMALYSQARFDEAEIYFRKSLETRDRELGSDHAETGQAINNLAMTLKMLGDYPKAEELLRRSIFVRQRTQGTEHPDVAVSKNNLALLLDELGRYDEAESLYRGALNITEKAVGPAHPEHARSLQNLSVYYSTQGDDEKAEEYGRRAFAICDKTYGADHPHTISAMTNIAFILDKRGDGQAKTLLQDALERTERTLGHNHPETAVSMHNVASVIHDSDELDAALELEREAYRICNEVGGWELPQTSEIAEFLARRLTEAGELGEAEPLHRRVLEHREQILGIDHPHTIRCLNNLLELLSRREPNQEMEHLFRRAVEDNEKVNGLEHEETAFAVRHLAAFLAKLECRQQGLLVYQDFVARLENSLGSDHESLRRHQLWLALQMAKSAEEEGDLDIAEDWYREELRLSEIVNGPENPETASSAFNLADLLQTKGNKQEAVSLLRRALNINEKSYGPDHPDTRESFYDLAEAVSATNRSEAIDLLQRVLDCQTLDESELMEKTNRLLDWLVNEK